MSKNHIRIVGFLTLSLSMILCGTAQAEYKLTWSEDFSGSSVNEKVWNHEVYPGVVATSREIAYYTDRPVNAKLANGELVVTACREKYDDCDFTTARLTTLGKQEFRYGRLEARIKLPAADGLHARLALLPATLEYGTWPASGGIDVFDVSGSKAELESGIHFGGSGPRGKNIINNPEAPIPNDLAGEYHVFGLEWQPYELRWYIDGVLYARQNNWWSSAAGYPAPFDRPFYLMLSLSVTQEAAQNSGAWQHAMHVDWIKLHQAKGNKPPAVKFTSPKNESKLPGNQAIKLTAEASDPENNLAAVEFYSGNTLIGKAQTAPYSFTWDAPDGCYKLTARAVDVDGYVCADTISIETGKGCPPTPYGGKPARIPGLIEAEDFDNSPKGEAWFDTDPGNNGNSYRLDTAVDIQPCNEGGFNLAWIFGGEWVDYSVNVTRSGLYDIRFRTASPGTNGRLHLEFDGKNITGTVVVPNTGDWQKFTDIIIPKVELTEGVQTMRLVAEQDGTNLNYFEITPSTDD